MALIYEWGFYVQPQRREELRDWLLANEQALAEAAPRDLEYLGTYLPVWATDRRCDLYQVWRWRRAGEFNFRTAADADKGQFADLASQFLAFVDNSRTEDETFRLHRSFTDSVPQRA